MGFACQEFHRRSLKQRDEFWAQQARLIDWHTPFQQVLDYPKPPFAKWFAGGETNLCYNAVDRHLAGRADQSALIYISTEVNQEKIYTYRKLHWEVQRTPARRWMPGRAAQYLRTTAERRDGSHV